MNLNTIIKKTLLIVPLLGLLLSGCAVNPVTGEKELTLVSEARELEIGRTQYAPSRQMQGGDFILDRRLSDYVSEVGRRLVEVSDRPQLPYEFKVINDSTPNAWALPGGKIAINRGLLYELESEAELAAVLGHEIVHSAARHGAKNIERGLLLQGAVLAAGVAASDSDFTQLAVGAASVGAKLINQGYSREAEREADYHGIKYMVRAGYNPQAAVDLQRTFVRLSEKREENWLSGLFSSHPPSQERVENNQAQVDSLGNPGGEWGKGLHKAAIAELLIRRPAYEAYDKGRKALQEGKTEKAKQLMQQAIRIEPQEALFYGLRGDIYTKLKQYNAARDSYTQALQRDNSFFAYYLMRGLARKELGDAPGAERDLKKSTQLLPTVVAHHQLGAMALDRGRRNEAKEHFQQAAGSSSEAGKAAAVEFARLDLSDNPGNYIKTQFSLKENGLVSIKVTNKAPFSVKNVSVQVGKRKGLGLKDAHNLRVRGALRPGMSMWVKTPIGPLQEKKQLRDYGSRVTHVLAAE